MFTSVGLFAGIAGIEEGLRRAGWQTELLCEIDPVARTVLRQQFPRVKISKDIRELIRLPRVDLVTAGFPCQDLSQAGTTRGIDGRKSGLVREVFRLLARRERAPKWVLLENVPFMLQLDGGRAMRVITTGLEELGYMWAYRTVDARAFGVPQRRKRVLILASKTEDPRDVLPLWIHWALDVATSMQHHHVLLSRDHPVIDVPRAV
jgi:DNA (cytosine-5)-methyltransferase 1